MFKCVGFKQMTSKVARFRYDTINKIKVTWNLRKQWSEPEERTNERPAGTRDIIGLILTSGNILS